MQNDTVAVGRICFTQVITQFTLQNQVIQVCPIIKRLERKGWNVSMQINILDAPLPPPPSRPTDSFLPFMVSSVCGVTSLRGMLYFTGSRSPGLFQVVVPPR